MSATWYTWMEQGRPTNPSIHALDRLARALRLDRIERAHLFNLARQDNKAAQDLAPSLSSPLDAMLRGLHPHPAYAMDVLWNVVAWNDAAAALLGEFDTSDIVRGNVLARLFLDPEWRRLFIDWEAIARSAVEQYRAATGMLRGDPQLIALVRTLEQASPDFAALWKEHDVVEPPACRKVVDHPQAGRLAFNYATLRPDSADDRLRFTIYTPSDLETARKFQALLKNKTLSS